MWIFTDISSKDAMCKEMLGTFTGTTKVFYSADKLDSFVYDDGDPKAREEDKITIDLLPYKFRFYAHDFTALRFEVRQAVLGHKEGDTNIRIKSNFCESFLSPEAGVQLYNYIEENAVALRERETQVLVASKHEVKDFTYFDVHWGVLSPDVKVVN
jgi:hypothetical protein